MGVQIMGRVKSMWMDEQERQMQRRREEIAHDYGLHLDDDGSAIDDILIEELEREMEREPIL